MATYEQFYKKVGTRLIRNFINPIVVDSSTFIFPTDSVLHWFKVSNILETFNKTTTYFNKASSVTILPVLKYNHVNPIGQPVDINRDEDILKTLAKSEKSFKILKPKDSINSVGNNVLLTYSYGGLTNNYKYTPHPLALVYKFNNSLETTVNNINNTTTNKFIFLNIDIPFNLLSRESLDKYSRGINANDLKKIITPSNLMLIELWKLLNPSLRKNSILDKLNPLVIPNVNILFTIDNKVTVVNLNILLSLVKDYNINTPLQKLNFDQVQQILYIHLYNVINLKPIRESNIKEIIASDVVVGVNGSIEEDNNVDLEDILKNDIIEQDDDLDLSSITDYEDFDDSYGEELMNNDLEELGYEIETDKLNLNMDEIVEFETLDDVLYNENDIELLKIKIEKLAESKVITSSNKKSALEVINKQQVSKDPYGNSKLVETLDISKDSYDVDNNKLNITDNKVVFDKRMNANTIKALDKTYLDNQYKKDIVRMVYGIQSSGILITDYSVVVDENLLGATEEHKISVKTLTGRASTLKLYLPKIESNGNFKLSGNTYYMRKQRAD